MRFRFSSAVFILIFSFTSFIVFADNICLITDEFWDAVLQNEMSTNSTVEKIKKNIGEIIPVFSGNSFKIENQKVDKLIIESKRISDMNFIIKEVGLTNNEIFILSPLLSTRLNELSEKFPDRYFITTAVVENENLRNVSIFKIDYADAYFKAGEWAALQESEVYAVFYIGSERLFKAEQSFSEGWSSIKNMNKLNLTTFSAIDDITPGRIEEFTNSVQSGENIAAVFTGPHNESYLNRFDGTSVLVLSEYARDWSESSYNIGGSIEVPVYNILSVIVKSVITDNYMDGGTVKADFFVFEHQ